MALAQVGQSVGGHTVVDSGSASTGGQAGTSNLPTKVFNASKDISSMKAALSTWNSSYFTTARLNTMSENDVMYVLLQNQTAINAALP